MIKFLENTFFLALLGRSTLDNLGPSKDILWVDSFFVVTKLRRGVSVATLIIM